MFKIGEMIMCEDMGAARITTYGIVLKTNKEEITIQWLNNHASFIPSDDLVRCYGYETASDFFKRAE